MGWSYRIFLVTADDELLRLPAAAFARMLRPDSRCRLPDLAGQRLRMAGTVVELADGIALGVPHCSFSMLDFDADGVLDVARLNAQQVARADSLPDHATGAAEADSRVVDAANRFVARGGSWEPGRSLRLRIESAAMDRVPCRRARVLG